jgi:hypothetical protein
VSRASSAHRAPEYSNRGSAAIESTAFRDPVHASAIQFVVLPLLNRESEFLEDEIGLPLSFTDVEFLGQEDSSK